MTENITKTGEEEVAEVLPVADETPLDDYVHSEELKAKLKDLQKNAAKDWVSAALQIAEDYGICFAATIFSKLCSKTAIQPLSWVGYAIAALIIGARMRAIAEVLHQASHYTLFVNRRVNNVVGAVFTAWPIFYSLSLYRKSHHAHHKQLADLKKDPDYIAMKDAGLYDKERSRTGVIAYLLRIPSLKNTLDYLRYLLINRIFATGVDADEQWYRLIFYGCMAILFSYFQLWSDYFFYWLVPFVTTASWIGSFIELLEHYPFMEDVPAKNCAMLQTRNRIASPVENFFFGIHHEGLHLVHHLVPLMPAWVLPQAHQLLMEDPLYYALHNRKVVGYAAIVEDMLQLADRKEVEAMVTELRKAVTTDERKSRAAAAADDEVVVAIDGAATEERKEKESDPSSVADVLKKLGKGKD